MIPLHRIAQLVPSLGRDNDHEVVATVRAIGSALRGAGCDFHDLAKAIERAATPKSSRTSGIGPGWYARQQEANLRTDRDKARWCADYGGTRLTLKERVFVQDLALRLARYGGDATERQSEWLEAIFARLRRAAA